MLKLWSELIALFVALPMAMLYWIEYVAHYLMVILGALGFCCLMVLLADGQFRRKKLWNWSGYKVHLIRALKLFAPSATLLALVFYLVKPELFLQLPFNQPWMWIATLLLYPVISVIPQEVIFRTYFFHRYKRILPSKHARWALSTFVFGLAHVVYGNLIAVIVSWCGGAIFGYRYIQSNSTPVVVIEHALWGCFLFTIGFGSYLVVA